MSFINRIQTFYWDYIATPKKYANHIGVVYGKNCLIATKSWGTEPYLIRIGDNVQVTKGVRFFTHGGGTLYAQKLLILMYLERFW